MFTSRGMQPVCPAQVLRPKSSGGGCTARIITKRKNRAKNARRPYKYNAITLWASFVCHKVTGNRPVWESVRFASERSRVRIPSSPPNRKGVPFGAPFLFHIRIHQRDSHGSGSE